MKVRIAVCLGLLLAMVAGGDAVAVVALSRSIGTLSKLVDAHRIQNMREHLGTAAQRVRAEQMASLASFPVEPARRDESQRQLAAAINRCHSCHHEDPIQAELDSVRAMTEAYLLQLNRRDRKGRQPLGMANVSESVQLGKRLGDRITATADRASQHLTVRGEQAMQSVGRARSLLFVALGLALALGLAGALHLQQRVTQPLRSIIEGIRQVRSGRREYRMALRGDSEFQEVAHAFNEAYEELQRSQRAVVHAERLAAVGQLAAGVAHEVLNPLASISSVLQILRSREEDPDYLDKIDLMMAEVDRVTKIVRDLQAFSQPRGQDQPINVDLHAALDHAIKMVSYDRRARNLMISRNFAADRVHVRGHIDRLLLVLTNVLLNALDAVNSHSVENGAIRVCTGNDANTVKVTVSDTGPGMTDEQSQRALEPFFTTKPPGTGTGLGLWTSYRIVEALGGSIAIESRLDQGTKVILRLPLCELAQY